MKQGFEWDPQKARSNEVKHGVTFEMARYRILTIRRTRNERFL